MVCFDMDGVLFKDVNFWMELHALFGTLEEGKRLTAEYLHTDYNRLVHEVVERLWKGKDAEPYFSLVNRLEYLPGVKDMMEHVHNTGYHTAIISASSMDVARRVQRDYGIDHLVANELVIEEGKVAGRFHWPIGVGKDHKAKAIQKLCASLGIPVSSVIYIGDSDTDIEAFRCVGRSIAFNSSSDALKASATHIVESCDLSDVIPYVPSRR